MNNYKYVDELIDELKRNGTDPQDIVWSAGLACVGWPYVFGARGEYCDPANRRARYREDHPTIKTSCKAFSGGGCNGCKWYPGEMRVRCFDCRGFTYWLLKKVYGFVLQGAGATSQWNTASNWKAKGKISDGVPANTLVCLFYSKDNKEKTWEHTGFGYKGQTLEASVNVQHFDKYNPKWTHWAIPACVGGEVPGPDPEPTTKATVVAEKGGSVRLRKAPSTSATVLANVPIGTVVPVYSVGKDWCEIYAMNLRGYMMTKFLKFGDEPVKRYQCVVPNLTEDQANELAEKYPGTTISEM